MRLPMNKATSILQLLVEGMSIRSIERITQVHRDTIMRVLVVAGNRCAKLMDEKMRNLTPRYLQVDEIWTYVGKKARKARHEENSTEIGDQWIFVGMDAETKVVASFRIGKRNWETTTAFSDDLYKRMAKTHRTQVTTDGFHFYKHAVPNAFGLDVDFAQLTKLYGDYGQHDAATRYSPSPIVEVISRVRQGDPDPDHISTSFIERQNLTMRMHMRRFTRLTNAFSKKLGNLKAAVALHFAWYNFCRVHKSLRVTPAMEAGIADRIWSVEDLICTSV
jgi:IS1 family transposase